MRGNPGNTGMALDRSGALEAGGMKRWTIGGALFSTPVVATGERVYAGGADGVFVAYDARAGKELWRKTLGGVVDSAACLDDDGGVYVPSGDGRIYALSTDTGEERWRFDVTRNRRYFTTSTIYWWEGNVAIGPDGHLYAGNDDFRLYSLTRDGQVRWSVVTGLQIWGCPAFCGDCVIAVSFDGNAYAFRCGDGQNIWRQSLGNFLAASPAVDSDGRVFIGSFDGSLHALGAADGKRLWRARLAAPIYSSPCITPDGHLCVVATDGIVHCLDRADGRVLWTMRAAGPFHSSPVVGRDPSGRCPYLVYFGDGSGVVYALEPNGAVRWSRDVTAPGRLSRFKGVNGSIAIGNDALYVPLAEGEIVALSFQQSPQAALAVPAPVRPIAEAVAASVKPGDVLRVDRVSVETPSIVMTLDQIGIASLTVDIGILRTDERTGRVLAWGVQRFGTDEEGNPIGVPSGRNLLFGFSGTVSGSGLRLTSSACHWEITAFPMPLDRLELVLRATRDGWEGVSFAAELKPRSIRRDLWRWFWESGRGGWFAGMVARVRSWLPEGRVTWRAFVDACIVAKRLTWMGWLLWYRWPWETWGLLFHDGSFHGKATFHVQPLPSAASSAELVDLSHDRLRHRIRARFRIRDPHERALAVPGILVVDAQTLEPVPIPFTPYTQVHRREADVIDVTLQLPRIVTRADGQHLALAMLNVTQLGELPFTL